jgi:hypothetical protein
MTLILVSVPLVMGLSFAGDEPAALEFEKECVIVGRIQGTDVMLYPRKQTSETDQQLTSMTRIEGFEILNLTSGEWQPLSLSKEGYFCANIRMGQYDLRGRDSEGRPYLVHRFNVPMHMAVNLGTFWIETDDPGLVAQDLWYNYNRTTDWREYQKGTGHIYVRLEHDTSREVYEDCESWFSGCYEEAYEHFEKVMARR